MLKKTLKTFAFAIVLTFVTLLLPTVCAAAYSINGFEIPVDIDVNGTYLEDNAKGFLGTDGITYVPVCGASEALGASVSLAANGNITVTKGYVTLVFNPAEQSCYVNNYYNYAPQIYKNGVLYSSMRVIFENLGATVAWDSYRYEAKVTLPGNIVPQRYVEQYYTPEDLYYLSKIVTCEAGNVSFEAKIMTANVILNRRASSSFPNTVYGVIFDTKYGKQFPPAHNGVLEKANPNTNTILACKVALNGVNLAPDCLYFNYAKNTTGWVAKNRVLYKVVDSQAFYK